MTHFVTTRGRQMASKASGRKATGGAEINRRKVSGFRIEEGLKQEFEILAKLEGTSMRAVLDDLVRDWVQQHRGALRKLQR